LRELAMIPWDASAALDARGLLPGISINSLRASVEAFDMLPNPTRQAARIICSEHVGGRRLLTAEAVEHLVDLLDYSLLSENSPGACDFAGLARIDCRAIDLADIRGGTILSSSGKRVPWDVGATIDAGHPTLEASIETLREAVEYFDTLPPEDRRRATIRCDTIVLGKEVLYADDIEELVTLL
jgi:hypothetical protein